MVEYPAIFPVDEAKVIVDAVRSGAVLSNRAAVAHAAWVLVGYGLKAGIGDPSPGAPMLMPPMGCVVCTDHAGVAALEHLIQQATPVEAGPGQMMVPNQFAALPPAVTSWLLELAMKLLTGYLTNRGVAPMATTSPDGPAEFVPATAAQVAAEQFHPAPAAPQPEAPAPAPEPPAV